MFGFFLGGGGGGGGGGDSPFPIYLFLFLCKRFVSLLQYLSTKTKESPHVVIDCFPFWIYGDLQLRRRKRASHKA